MADADLIKLYSQRILALAADVPHAERLAAPDATATRRSPLCGSTVTVDVTVQDGRIADLGMDVKACALGQASASILGAQAIGRSLPEIEASRDALKALLKKDPALRRCDPPAEIDSAFEVLTPAQDYKNRHASILLAWEATVEAMAAALETAGDPACSAGSAPCGAV
jgi:NifU-like protein involved in Fe-S cluster formation